MDAESLEFDPAALRKPDGVESRGPSPAGFNERFIAYVVDAFPFVLAARATLPLLLKSGAAEYSPANELKWKLAWIAIYVAYETVFSSGGRATLGKYLMGIRVKAGDGAGDLSLAGALVRTLAYFASAAPLNLGYIAALFTPGNRALHDYIGRSRVISVKERSDWANGLVLAVSWSLMIILTGSWVNQNFLRLGPEEMEQVAAARTTVGKIARLEEIHKARYGGYTDDLKRLAFLTRNTGAVRAEIERNIEPGTLAIASDGRAYIISAKARNWRHTEVRREYIPK